MVAFGTIRRSMLDYKIYIDKIGLHFDIVNGDLVESETGPFVVSEEFKENTIYLNKLTKTVSLIIPKDSYTGRTYRLRNSDCTTLWCRWLDTHKGSNYREIYKNISNKQFVGWMKAGMCPYFDAQPFQKITDYTLLQESDCLVYSFNNLIDTHVGVYIPEDKILHHLPRKFSSLDILDRSKILGAYRYAN
jgi:hypothetical protein